MRPPLLLSAPFALAFALAVVAPCALAPCALAQTATRPPTPAIPPRTNGSPTTGSVMTDAPTPDSIPDQVSPDDRAGNNTTDPAGPVRSTPFSAGPQGGTGGQISPALRETEPANSPSTPELGR